jgi:hypothetical protein
MRGQVNRRDAYGGNMLSSCDGEEAQSGSLMRATA